MSTYDLGGKEFVEGRASLFGSISITNGNRAVFKGLEINHDAERRANFVLASVALTNVAIVIPSNSSVLFASAGCRCRGLFPPTQAYCAPMVTPRSVPAQGGVATEGTSGFHHSPRLRCRPQRAPPSVNAPPQTTAQSRAGQILCSFPSRYIPCSCHCYFELFIRSKSVRYARPSNSSRPIGKSYSKSIVRLL